ncbi:hypothetical protein GCM10027074_56980 [Streptomyces deserti]
MPKKTAQGAIAPSGSLAGAVVVAGVVAGWAADCAMAEPPGKLASRIGGARTTAGGLTHRARTRVRARHTVARPCRSPTGFRRAVVNVDETVPRRADPAKGARKAASAPRSGIHAVKWRTSKGC